MQRVLITGTSRGIGLEFTRRYAMRGDLVFATCRVPAEASALTALAAEYPGRIITVPLDTADQASIDQAHHIIAAQTDVLDVLINNAGVSADDETLTDITFETSLEIIRTNAVGPLLVARAFLDLLQAGNEPRIVSISSEYGSLSFKNSNDVYSYAASKAALNMFTRTLSFEVQPMGINTVIIDPGWVRTDMGGRFATLSPEESVRGMLRIIDRLTEQENGRFFRWDGAVNAW